MQICKNAPIPDEVTPKTKLSHEEYNVYLKTPYLKGIPIQKIYGPESFATPLVQPSLTQPSTIQESPGIGTLSRLPKEPSISTLSTPQVATAAGDLSKVGVSDVSTLLRISGRLHQLSTEYTPPGAVGGVSGAVKLGHQPKPNPVSELTEQFAKIKAEGKPKEDVLKKGQDPKSRKSLFQ